MDGPEPDPSEDVPRELEDALEELPDPDDREILSDGSGGTLVESEGDGPRRVVAERDVDEVFEDFEEDSPEEVMAADDYRHPDAGESLVEGDIEGLFGDARLVGPEPEPVVDRRNVDELLETVQTDRTGEELFDEREGHKRVVGDSDVDEVFERYVEDDPADVIEANDPALESPTEAELRSIGRPDDPLGELPDPPADARTSGVGAFVGDGPETMERTGEDTHRSVGETDVDAVFENFEEDSVEEVIESAGTDPEDDEMVETEVDEPVEALFGDMSDVDLEASPVSDVEDDDGPTPAPSPEETADAIEGLLTDLSGVDLASGPSPEETADAIEGLLTDLSDVETDANTPMTDESARASGPEFGPADGTRSELEGPGADVTSGVAVNRVPSDDAVDVSATDLFCAFAGDGPVDTPDDLEVGGEWGTATGPEPGDVTARERFDALADRVEEPPATSVPGTSDAGEHDVPEITLDVPAPEDGSDADVSGQDGESDAATADGAVSADEELDVPEIELPPPGRAADSTTADSTTAGAGDRPDDAPAADGEPDVPEIDLTPPEETADSTTAHSGDRRDEAVGEDAPEIDPNVGASGDDDASVWADDRSGGRGEVTAGADDAGSTGATAGGDERSSGRTGTTAAASDGTERPPEDGTAAEGSGAATTEREFTGKMAETDDEPSNDVTTASNESDEREPAPSEEVEDLFAGYEEDTPEEIIASADAMTRGDEPDDAIVGDVEGLFGDLSEVDLEPAGTEDGPSTTADATSERAPDSEAAVEEVEEMFANLDSVNVEPSPADDAEPARADPDADERPSPAEAGSRYAVDIEPAHERGDRVREERDVDAVFDDFEEETVDEVIEREEVTTGPAGTDDGDEPAEVETGDFMKELAEGKDPEEIGITLYDGSQVDDEGAAIAGSSTDGSSTDGPSIETASPGPSDGRPSIEDPTGGADRTAADDSPDSRYAGESSTAPSPGDGASGRDGPSIEAGTSSEDEKPAEATTADLFEEMSDSSRGSETLFPAESDEREPDRTDDGTVVGAFKLLIDRIGDRLRDLF